MAVVLRLPDRPAAAVVPPRQAVGAPLRTAEILILPCIRREPLERPAYPRDRDDGPAQLQA